jgi:hypothetical protein
MSRALVLRRQGGGLATATSLILLLCATMMLTTHAVNVATATLRHRKARVDRQDKQPVVVAELPNGVQTATNTTQRRETILEDQMHMLSTGQLEKLRNIEAGALRKHEVCNFGLDEQWPIKTRWPRLPDLHRKPLSHPSYDAL